MQEDKVRVQYVSWKADGSQKIGFELMNEVKEDLSECLTSILSLN